MRRARRGFTFIELLVVVIVIGILAGIGVLKYIDLRHRATSAAAASDFEAIRLAAYGAWYETGNWPAETSPGVVPAALTHYLPSGFTFTKPQYTLDWENFAPPGGGPSGGMQLGVVLSSTDPRLTKALAQNLGSRTPFVSINGTLTFVIVGPDGKI
jgi:prepilin-type N-terminal cleavage/methylation domain-containing protein